MLPKSTLFIVRLFQILLVFVLSAVFSSLSFAAQKPACDMKGLAHQAQVFNKNIDPDLKVSIKVQSCRIILVGRSCEVTAFNSYQLTTLPRLPDQSMLRALNIQSFGRNAEGTGYILAIPKCSG